MARRRKDPETRPSWSFEVPDFDEDEYIRKETISFRTTVILFVWGIIAAVVSFLVWLPLSGNPTGAWLTAMVIGGILGYLLRYIYRWLRVDIDHFQRKDWVGTGFLYFFSWLAFLILFTNPPIHDAVPPVIELHVSPDAQEPGGPVLVHVIAHDNSAIDLDSLRFEVTGPDGSSVATAADLTRLGDDPADSWRWSLTDTEGREGEYQVRVSISDTRGGRAVEEASFVVGDVLRVAMTGGGDLSTKLDRITVEIPDSLDVWRVYLELDSDAPDATVELAHDAENDVWAVGPAAPGFYEHHNRTSNLTVGFHVVVVEHDAYILPQKLPSDDGAADAGPEDGVLRSQERYEVTFSDAALLSGDVETQPAPQRDIGPKQVPSVGAALGIAALVGLVVLVRRRD